MKKVVIITGGSSGIGQAAAKLLREAGCVVHEFSRRDCGGENHHRVDVSDEAAVRAAVEEVIAREGHVDILVNNAGFGISGAMEFTDPADARRLMQVNLLGMDNMIRAVLPGMRRAGHGRIVCVGSMAGVFPIPFQAWYSISKAAVSALTMALHNEVSPYGIEVCDVLPGDIRTGFTDARRKNRLGDSEYGGRIERSVGRMEKDERSGMPPEAAAKVIARAALTRRRVRPHYVVGTGYRLLAILGKLLPSAAVRKLLFLLYAR